MKKLNEHGSHVIAILLVVVGLAGIGFAGWRVFEAKKASEEGASTQKPTEHSGSDSGGFIWQPTETGWQAVSMPPVCPDPLNLHLPVKIDSVTGILYPGQIRSGNYKAHGGFRFDKTPNNQVTVTAPIDGYIVRGGQYAVEGEPQYTIDVMNNCGIMYRLGHLRELSPAMQKLAEKWTKHGEGDSRTGSVTPPVFLKQGEAVATSVGITKGQNTFFDWGVYDFRQENEASKHESFRSAHMSDKETAWHGVCWFDLLSSLDEAKVKALPSSDPNAGKISDYCK